MAQLVVQTHELELIIGLCLLKSRITAIAPPDHVDTKCSSSQDERATHRVSRHWYEHISVLIPQQPETTAHACCTASVYGTLP